MKFNPFSMKFCIYYYQSLFILQQKWFKVGYLARSLNHNTVGSQKWTHPSQGNVWNKRIQIWSWFQCELKRIKCWSFTGVCCEMHSELFMDSKENLSFFMI